jgi:small-conductance mechanosensitive channel
MNEVNYFELSLLQTKVADFFLSVLAFLPQILIAVIIWFVGSYLIEIGVRLFRTFFIKQVHEKNTSHLRLISRMTSIIGKIFLMLFILEYLGIGRTFITAFVSSLSNAIAIMIGLSFGLALQDDAKKIIRDIKNYFDK